MSRPLRIEFDGAIYRVTSRGDRREPIYRDDVDRKAQVDAIAQAMKRFDPRVLAYGQTGNHYHLVLQTLQVNLSRLMRHVNGMYTRAFNRRHGVAGHLFFKGASKPLWWTAMPTCWHCADFSLTVAGSAQHSTDRYRRRP